MKNIHHCIIHTHIACQIINKKQINKGTKMKVLLARDAGSIKGMAQKYGLGPNSIFPRPKLKLGSHFYIAQTNVNHVCLVFRLLVL